MELSELRSPATTSCLLPTTMSHHTTTEYIGLLTDDGFNDGASDGGGSYHSLTHTEMGEHQGSRGGFAEPLRKPRRRRKKKNCFLFDLKLMSFLLVGTMTLVYTVAEIGIAVWLNSLSLLSDGFHNLSDVISLVIAFWAVQVSKRVNSDSMSYGWARSEILGGLTNGVFLISLSLYIVLEAIPRYYKPEHLDARWAFIGIAAGGVLVNTLGTVIFAVAGNSHAHSHGGGGHGHSHGGSKKKKHGHSHGSGHGHSHGGDHGDEEEGHGHSHGGHGHSHGKSKGGNFITRWYKNMDLNVGAVFIHYLGDMISSLIVLAEGLVLHFIPDANAKWTDYVDPSASLLIVALILFTTYPIVKRASFILMQGTPSDVELDAIRNDLSSVGGVLSVHDLHVWRLIESINVCSVHVAIEEGVDFSVVIEQLRAILHEHDIHSSTIQPEFHPAHARLRTTCESNCVKECDEDWCCKDEDEEK